MGYRRRCAARGRRRRRDRGGAPGRERVVAAGRPLRAAGDPHGTHRVEQRLRLVDPAGHGNVRGPEGGGRGRRPRGAGARRARAPGDPREGLPGGRGRGDPHRAGRRPFDHLPECRGRGAPPLAPLDRHRALRRARRHRRGPMGLPGGPRHADAPAHRRGVGRGRELRPGGPARLLARAGDLRTGCRSRACAGTRWWRSRSAARRP